MDDVRVEYNASMPGTVGAHAVTTGNRIAVAPGQERHVAHEAWHVAQQKMRKVRADTVWNGFEVNTDRSLEAEADAFQDDLSVRTPSAELLEPVPLRSLPAPAIAPLQLKGSDDEDDADDEADDEHASRAARSRRARRREAGSKASSVVDASPGPSRRPRPRPTADDASALTSVMGQSKRRILSTAASPPRAAPSTTLPLLPPSKLAPTKPDIVATPAALPRRSERFQTPSIVARTPSTGSSALTPLAVTGTPVPKAPLPKPSLRPSPRRFRVTTRGASTPAFSSPDAMASAAAYVPPEEFKRPASPAPEEGSLGAAMAKAVAPSSPAVTARLAKKRVAHRSKRDASQDESDDETRLGAGGEVGELDALVGTFGASQQGLISIEKGKHYHEPQAHAGRRYEQVSRHYANLALNNVAVGQKAIKGAKPPVEVQMSLVGSRILINTNNRESSEMLVKRLNAAGGLHGLALDPDSLTPAMDPETERPVRHRNKLKLAQDKERPWQKKGAVGETALDRSRAAMVLAAAASRGKVGVFDPDDEDGVASRLDDWRRDKAPRVFVVLHSAKRGTNKDEHAERVQTRFRMEHLGEFESENPAPPVGPKTTCLGCAAFHEEHAPDLNPHENFSGALFKKGSPVEGDVQLAAAHKLIKNRPASGSVSQKGILRNSDRPDSDTDEDGDPVYPRPGPMSAKYGGKTARFIRWTDRDGTVLEAPKSVKADRMKGRFDRKRAKSQPPSRARSLSMEKPSPAASTSLAASATPSSSASKPMKPLKPAPPSSGRPPAPSSATKSPRASRVRDVMPSPGATPATPLLAASSPARTVLSSPASIAASAALLGSPPPPLRPSPPKGRPVGGRKPGRVLRGSTKKAKKASLSDIDE